MKIMYFPQKDCITEIDVIKHIKIISSIID